MLWTAHDVATYSDDLHGATWAPAPKAARWTWIAGRKYRGLKRL